MDVSDTQREQIREWIALEGVRDVNLLPRAVAEDVASSRVSITDAVNPMAFAEPRSTLLDAFGGTAPETLGPPLPELFASTAAAAAEPLRSQGFDDVRTPAFRENEWDLASVTMVPRKKPKPEGLSAFALILLWIAIPSFGIGILVGRRPLERWLSRGDAVGKSFSTKSPSQTLPSATPDLSASGHRADVKFSQEIPPNLPINTEPFESDVLTINPAETYRPGDSNAFVDVKLLNSMSTQEARAFKNVGSPSTMSATSPNKNNFDKKSAMAANASAAPEITQPKSTSPFEWEPPKVPGGLGGVAPNSTAVSAPAQNTTMMPPATSAGSNSSISQSDPSRDANSSIVRQNSLAPAVRSATPPVSARASASATVLPSSKF